MMEIKEIMDFAEWEAERKSKAWGMDDEKSKMYDSMKLSEEVGELIDEILRALDLQRKEKGAPNNDNLAEELADVVLVLSLLAKRFNVDLEEALKNKIEKVKGRVYEK